MRQITTGSNLPIVAPVPKQRIWGTTVSPDGDFIDFVRGEPGSLHIWRVPFIGGTPKIVINDVSSPVGWSPDGRQLAFLRTANAVGREQLIVARPDGSGERVLATRQRPDTFTSLFVVGRPPLTPAWSPRGDTIAVMGASDGPDGNRLADVVFVNVADGKLRAVPVGAYGGATGIAWQDEDTVIFSRPSDQTSLIQLWRMGYPSGIVTRLTNDLNSYIGISMTADRRALATTRSDQKVSILLSDAKGVNPTTWLPPAPTNTAIFKMSWAGDRLVVPLTFGGRRGIALLTPGNAKAEHVYEDAFDPSVSPDGSTLVFISGRTRGLWKATLAGDDQVELVSSNSLSPFVSADGRHIVFLSSAKGVQSPWVVPITGGEPVQLSATFVGVGALDVSPRTNSVMFVTSKSPTETVTVVCELPKCDNRQEFPYRPFGTIRWTPDDRAIAYSPIPRTNIWIQPLDGRPARQLTNFSDEDPILDFNWSRDGKRLAIARASVTDDIVLFKGLRK